LRIKNSAKNKNIDFSSVKLLLLQSVSLTVFDNLL